MAPLPLTGRTKYEPDLWHLDGARHNPFKFGRLTLETAELFASVSWRLSPPLRSGLSKPPHQDTSQATYPYNRRRTIPDLFAAVSCPPTPNPPPPQTSPPTAGVLTERLDVFPKFRDRILRRPR